MDYVKKNCEIDISQMPAIYKLEDMMPIVQKTVQKIVSYFDKTEMDVRQMFLCEQWELRVLRHLLDFYCKHCMYNEAVGLIKKLENLNLHYFFMEKFYLILGEHIGLTEVWHMAQQKKLNKIEKTYKYYEVLHVLQKSFIKTIAKLRQEQYKKIKVKKTNLLSYILEQFVLDVEMYTREDTKKEKKGEN